MEKTEQQENYLDNNFTTEKIASEQPNETEKPKTAQFVLPQEALYRTAELERKYREIVERENK